MGHRLSFINQPINESGYGEGIDFLCNVCKKKGEFKDGAYHCAECKYDVHKRCANVEKDKNI